MPLRLDLGTSVFDGFGEVPGRAVRIEGHRRGVSQASEWREPHRIGVIAESADHQGVTDELWHTETETETETEEIV